MEEGGGEELGAGSSPPGSERGSSPAGSERQPSSARCAPCVLTVSLAIPQKQMTTSPPNRRGKGVPADELRTKRCYHIEYFLLPDDLVPRKMDLMVFGTVAKLFGESDSKTIVPWLENDQMWISWNHNTNVNVTNEFLIKLRDHKITLKLWDTKDKVFSEARLSKPDVSSTERDAEAVGKSNANRYVIKCTLKLSKGIQGTEKIFSPSNQRYIMTTGLRAERERKSITGNLRENSVISRLEENSPILLDAYVSFTVETPLLSERQRHELNPLVIKIYSATSLPNTPIPIEVLQRLCVPTYCKYKFHNFPAHQTHGQIHGTHVYFKDVNVFLTGTMKPGELQRYLRGPPLEIEVHDRDRKIEDNKKKLCLFGEDQADENLGEARPLACKSTICNSSTENEMWHPHGVAKVSLTDLLLGKKYLAISAPIRSCSTPNTSAFNKEDKSKKIGKKYPQILLPMGHYLQSDSLLKVRVEIAVPLRMHAEVDDAQVTDCPYGCIIYIFDYSNSSLLYDLVEEITEINAKALQLDCYPPHIIRMALDTLKLESTLEKDSELDIVTGFHLLDGASHLFVLEGLKDKAIKRLWDRHFERTYRREDGQLEILYNSQLSFSQRLYTDLEAIFYHFHLCKPLFSIAKQPLLYVRGAVPWACFQALSRLSYLCHSKRLRDVIQGGLLPSAEMVTALSREYGAPLTDEDLFTQKPPLLSFSSDCAAPGNVSREKKGGYSSLDDYNEKYVQWKKEMADKKIYPADGKSVYNYSSQSLNSAELAKKHLRQEMAKEPKTRFTYCHEYLSAMFDPVDVVTACKESFAKSKSMWLSPDGFVFPGFKSSIESNLHPRMPDEARVEELQENALYANMGPVLSRGRWSWDKRRVDFELYKKPPEPPLTTDSLTGKVLLISC
uniref:Cilia and flagella associated protein 92 (putative) n=1 Tax=Phasianus colchicus TaxID=9054 RepID=A0A669P5G4_PHACC